MHRAEYWTHFVCFGRWLLWIWFVLVHSGDRVRVDLKVGVVVNRTSNQYCTLLLAKTSRHGSFIFCDSCYISMCVRFCGGQPPSEKLCCQGRAEQRYRWCPGDPACLQRMRPAWKGSFRTSNLLCELGYECLLVEGRWYWDSRDARGMWLTTPSQLSPLALLASYIFGPWRLTKHTYWQWSTDIMYWLNNSMEVGYQNQSTAFIIGGDNVRINGFGTGTFNGNGDDWYKWIRQQENTSNYPGRPHALTLSHLTNSAINGLRFLRSQMWYAKALYHALVVLILIITPNSQGQCLSSTLTTWFSIVSLSTIRVIPHKVVSTPRRPPRLSGNLLILYSQHRWCRYHLLVSYCL